MPIRPFQFVHASDLHLERPPSGVEEVPDHLKRLFIDAAYRAAEKVFDTAVTSQADFLLLVGDILDPDLAGPARLRVLVRAVRTAETARH